MAIYPHGNLVRSCRQQSPKRENNLRCQSVRGSQMLFPIHKYAYILTIQPRAIQS